MNKKNDNEMTYYVVYYWLGGGDKQQQQYCYYNPYLVELYGTGHGHSGTKSTKPNFNKFLRFQAAVVIPEELIIRTDRQANRNTSSQLTYHPRTIYSVGD